MQTRGKKVKDSKRSKKQRMPRATSLPTSENELHGPEHEDLIQEINEIDDTAFVKACLASKDSHAKARMTMDALGDGDVNLNQEEGNEIIQSLAEAEQAMAAAGLALRTYWETVPPEIAAALETRYAAAHDLLALLTGDRATAAAFVRAADRELNAAHTEEHQPPTAQELQAAVAKAASARAIFEMRARAIDDFFRARDPQVLNSGNQQQPKAAKANKKKKQPVQPQPNEPAQSPAKDPVPKRKTKAAGARQPVQQQEERQTPGARTPRRRAPARADSPPKQRGEAVDYDTDGQMPALAPDSSDEDESDAGEGRGQREGHRADARAGRGILPTYETTNDSDYVWDGDDVQGEDEEDWGRHQNDKDYDFDQEYAEDEADAHGGIFAHGKVQSGYDYLKGAQELQFPSNAPQAAILERINVSAISHGTCAATRRAQGNELRRVNVPRSVLCCGPPGRKHGNNSDPRIRDQRCKGQEGPGPPGLPHLPLPRRRPFSSRAIGHSYLRRNTRPRSDARAIKERNDHINRAVQPEPQTPGVRRGTTRPYWRRATAQV